MYVPFETFSYQEPCTYLAHPLLRLQVNNFKKLAANIEPVITVKRNTSRIDGLFVFDVRGDRIDRLFSSSMATTFRFESSAAQFPMHASSVYLRFVCKDTNAF